MATLLRNRRITSIDAAQFRAWCQDFHDALVAAGWVQTTDTGQINLTTVAAPTGTGQIMGYEIWRMADALQATAPVFMKVEYGTVGSVANPGGYITAGQGSDGAGNLTGKQTNRQQFGMVDPVTAINAFFSGTTSRFAFCWHVPNNGNGCLFTIERTKDVNGADTNEGFLFYVSFMAGSNPQGCGGAIIFGVNAAQLMQTYVDNHFGPPMNTPMLQANDGTDVGVHPFSIPSRRGSEQPGMGVLAYWRNDFAAAAIVTVNIYGADHTYICVGGIATNQGQWGSGCPRHGDQMWMMRYE